MEKKDAKKLDDKSKKTEKKDARAIVVRVSNLDGVFTEESGQDLLREIKILREENKLLKEALKKKV